MLIAYLTAYAFNSIERILSPGRNGSPEPVNTSFNSIERIRDTLLKLHLEALQEALSIPLNGFLPSPPPLPPLPLAVLKLSIPLNGFTLVDFDEKLRKLISAFNSIERILNRTKIKCSNKEWTKLSIPLNGF